MKGKLIIALFLIPFFCFAQRAITEEEVLSLALKNSSLISASLLSVSQSKPLQKTAYNFSSPEIMMESPTGEFQTVGVIQSINFPTVYVKQFQLYKQQTEISIKNNKVYFYLLDGKAKTMRNKGVTSSVVIQFADGWTKTIQLTANGDDEFTAGDAKAANYSNAIVAFKVNDKTATAKFKSKYEAKPHEHKEDEGHHNH